MSTNPNVTQLISQLQEAPPDQRLFLVTGERGAGKTTWLIKLIATAKQAGFEVCGLLTPGVFENGVKTGINLKDLASGETRLMSDLVEAHLAAGQGGIRRLESGVLVLGGWRMHENVMLWGNEILQQLLNQPPDSKTSANRILIIDELGPLEFIHGLGFTNAIQYGSRLNPGNLVDASADQDNNQNLSVHQEPLFAAAFIVVRPGLLHQAFKLWPQAHTLKISR